MAEFTVQLKAVLKENLYCRECGEWVYTPEMNGTCKNEQGQEVECIGEGCVKKDAKGEFMECPGCSSRYYIND